MSFDDIVALLFPTIFIAFLLAERLIGGGRKFPAIRFWTLTGFVGLFASAAVNAVVPLLVVPVFAHARVVDLSALALMGALPALVLTTFFTYWSHRLQHSFDVLWRMGHQLHHAVARVDVASGMMFHPIDVFVQAAMTTLAAAVLGVTPEAAALAGVANFAIALFQHLNVATPRWAGYLIQRPEAHVLHHERDIHSRNFGDLPVWDMLFGTYANPQTVDAKVGFEPDRGRRVLAMIACIDVNRTRGRAKV